VDPNLRRVLSQTVRVEILERIAKRPSSARQIAEATGEPFSKIAYHTSVLCESGCIRPRDPTHTDPGERVYEIASLDNAPPPRLPLSDTTRGEVISSILRRIVEKGRAALAAGTFDGDGSRVSCDSILLDEQGLLETQAILDEAAKRIAATRAETAKRLSQTGAKRVWTTVALAAFESPEDEKSALR
jgi:hypothetical protein